MKKRFISILLTVLMVLSLFSGLSVNAYADETANTAQSAKTVAYTMAEGDTVLRVCQRAGLNFYTCKPAIMALNNITSEAKWSKIAVGTTLIFPASDYDAVLIANGGTVAQAGAAQAGAAQTGSTSTSAVTTAKSRDVVAYYLVPYTMAVGDTVSGVCANLGVNFNIFHEFIRQVNGIANWNRVQAGTRLLIPTPVTPNVGTSCYAVMRHTVASNETAYSIASANGINYNSYKSLLETINLTDNLASIKVDGNFYYPAQTTILYPGTGASPTSSTTTTTTTTVDGGTTTTTTTVTSSKLYKLTSNMSSSDGTMVFFVGEKPVNEARSGDVITIVTETNSGKAIESLTVKHLDGSADLMLKGDTFIMPACDVRVDAAVASGHDITLEANYPGKASATVGGVSVRSAVKGAVVSVVSTDPTYEIESVYATYKRFSWLATKTQLSVTNNSFVMPDMPVTIEVSLKPVTTYAFFVTTVGRGSFFLQVNGSSVTRAAKGAQVTVIPKAQDGYEPAGILVTNRNTGNPVNIFNNTFTMPASDVDVQMIFRGKGNNIVLMPAEGGTVTSNPADEAPTGTAVTLTATADAGYTLNGYDVVRNSDGLKVNVTAAGTFVMPEGGVTVTPVFVGNAFGITGQMFIDGTSNDRDCSFQLSYTNPTTGALVKGEFAQNGDTSAARLGGNVPAGVYVDLRSDCSASMAFARYRILAGGAVLEEETNEANYHGYFQMPSQNITIEAYFEKGKIAIGYAAVTGSGSVSYRDPATRTSIATCEAGDTVEIILTPGEGHTFDYAAQDARASKLLVTRKDNNAPLQLARTADGYSFVMPAEGVNIQAIFDTAPYTLTMRTVDENGTNLNGQGFWQIAINGVVGAADNDPNRPTTVNVAYGDTVVVAMTEAGYTKYDLVSFKINGYEYVADVLNYFYNFTMTDRRAQNLEIVATLRPKVPYEPVFHALTANYDVLKGNVEFLLLDRDPRDPVNGTTSSTYSTQYQSTVAGGNRIRGAQFVKYAFAGDWVAIVAGPNNAAAGFVVNTDNITITGSDATRIVPFRLQGWNVDGVAVDLFVFNMPDTDVNISVNFTGTANQLVIRVLDENGAPASGMVRVSTDGQIYRDVAADGTFGTVDFNKTVYITRTELAMSQNKRITSFLVNAMDAATGTSVPVPYIDLYEAYQFTMPNNPMVVVNIQIGDAAISLLTPIVRNVINGNVVLRNANGEIITDAQAGEDVYITAVPNDGYQQLKGGELKVIGSNGTNIAEFLPADTATLPYSIASVLIGDPHSAQGVWHFVMPQGGVAINATFQKETAAYALTFSVNGGEAQISTFINGANVIKPIQDGDTVNVSYGQVIYIAPNDGYGWDAGDIKSAKVPSAIARNGVIRSYTVPDLSQYGDSDTITLYLKPTEVEAEIILNAPNCSTVIKNGSGAVLTDTAQVGDSVIVEVTASTGYQFVGDVIVTNRADDTVLATVTPSDGKAVCSFTVPSGGVTITAQTERKTAEVTFDIPAVNGKDPQVKVAVDGTNIKNFKNGEKIELTYGQIMTVTLVGDYTWNGDPTATSGKCELKNDKLTYTTYGNNGTLTIKLKATVSSNSMDLPNENAAYADAADEAAAEAAAVAAAEAAAQASVEALIESAAEDPVD